MPRSGQRTRETILDAAYELFYRRGYARVGVDDVAGHAQVTKRTLYNHFSSKDALLAGVLDRHHALAVERIARWSKRLPHEPRAMLRALFAELAGWASRPRWSGAGFTRLVMELADLPGHPARAIARRHKAVVEAWLAGEFSRRRLAAPQERARQVMLLLEGCQIMMLIAGDRRYATSAAKAALRLFEMQLTR